MALDATEAGFTVSGLDVDAMNRNLLFTGGSAVYSASVHDVSDYAAVYADLTDPIGVAADGTQGLLFWTDKNGVYMGDIAGSSEKTFFAART